MRDSISTKLTKTLFRGKSKLGKEARQNVAGFVASQRFEDFSFKNKAGEPDIYYTLFGWLLSYALGVKLDKCKMATFLDGFDIEQLDLVHYTAYVRCRMAHQFLEKGIIGRLFSTKYTGNVKELYQFEKVPQNDYNSPYTQYVWLALSQDAGKAPQNKESTLRELNKYRAREGGFANSYDQQVCSLNATTAALSVIGQLKGYTPNEDVEYLRSLQQSNGGFAATAGAPVPDLLSTATALFTLHCYGMQPLYKPGDFLEAHWSSTGGFCATLLDDLSDVEYTFYGMLALGTL